MADTLMNDFVALSAIITGIDADLLAPPLAPPESDVKTVYFNTAQQREPAAFQQLLAAYAAIRTETPAQIGEALMVNSPDEIRFLCRTIILMWYQGNWYSPADLKKNAGTNNQVSSSVISANAYTQGWVWSVAQAHPMGYSNLTFGYWSQNPPSLADFIGGA